MDADNIAGFKDVVTGSTQPQPTPYSASPPVGSSPELKKLLGIAIAAFAISALYFAQEVLIPITLAVMLSFLLSPVVNLLQRARLWRAPAVILTVLAALAFAGLIGTIIGSQAAGLSANAPEYAKTIEAKVEGVQSFAVSRMARITKALTVTRPAQAPARQTRTVPTSSLVPAASEPQSAQAKPVLVRMEGQQTNPLVVAKAILEPILSPLGTTFLVLIVAIFVMMQKEDLRDRFIRLFGSNDLHRTTLAMDDAGQRLSKYFLSQMAVNTTFGVVIGIGLWLIGIPSPAMWGILAGLLRFVPYIGSALAALAPMALGAAIDPGWSSTIYVAVMFLIVETSTGYIVEPMLYGHSTGLSPVSVIISAIFWTWLWGPIGLILSTPLTLCMVVLGRHVKSLEFFDVLLGDRPALSPVESFYQRILANNPDEALAQAELLLADRSLTQYYDSVILGGLKLAAEDEAKGTIDRARADTMIRSIGTILDELEDHREPANPAQTSGVDAADPQTRASVAAVACVAGRDPFDQTVSTMLSQLLMQRGQSTRLITNDMVSRDAIANLDLSGIETVVISCLEISGSPAYLRFLIRRVRQRAPTARIILGLWPDGAETAGNTNSQQTVGADQYVGSLDAAVTAILGSAPMAEAA